MVFNAPIKLLAGLSGWKDACTIRTTINSTHPTISPPPNANSVSTGATVLTDCCDIWLVFRNFPHPGLARLSVEPENSKVTYNAAKGVHIIRSVPSYCVISPSVIARCRNGAITLAGTRSAAAIGVTLAIGSNLTAIES